MHIHGCKTCDGTYAHDSKLASIKREKDKKLQSCLYPTVGYLEQDIHYMT
jgi:hypothetical protein